MKGLFCVFAAAAIATASLVNLTSCDKEPGAIRVTAIQLAPEQTTIEVDQTTSLSYTILPTDATDQAVAWSSDSPAVAEVSASGVVTGRSVGQTTIRVSTSDGAKTASCVVTVKLPTVAVTDLSLDKEQAQFAVGESETLRWTIYPAGATDKAVSWKSSDSAVATVDDKGLVTAVGPGEATLTVTSVSNPDQSASCIVIVRIAVTGITVEPDKISVRVGDVGQLTARVLPVDATNQNVSWRSSAQSTVSVDAEGNYTALRKGSARLTATTEEGSLQAACVVTVTGYESADFSADGTVMTLQEASQGAGIDVVIMGDGYSDRQIANGEYERQMRQAMELFFVEEPYVSFREMFNIHAVNVVSQFEATFDGSSSALGCRLNAGSTLIQGSQPTILRYTRRAIGESRERMNETVIMVMVNSTSWHGTCYFGNSDAENDWGSGRSINFFSVGESVEQLTQLLNHESNGHGFAKLGDEYWYYDDESVSDAEVAYYVQEYLPRGWYKNLAFTSDPAAVSWARYLTDPRYSDQGLGVYEGGLGMYGRGVWRSTWNSMMRHNNEGFNAPSREAIYYRIHKLAFGGEDGSGWTYDHEAFVAWDLAHRGASAAARRSRAVVAGSGVLLPRPHQPPIFVADWGD